MDAPEKTEHASFLAMFYPRTRSTNSALATEDFIATTGKNPDLSITTNSLDTRIALSSRCQTAFDADTDTTLVLYGDVYNTSRDNKAAYLLQQFLKHGLKFASEVNGTFAILLIDGINDEVRIITDRLNSKKVFNGKLDGRHWLSTSLHPFLTATADVDIIGAACYLVNGTVHSNRTLFDGIRSLERACVHHLNANGFTGQEYWSCEYTQSKAGIPEKQLRSDFSDLIVESVKLRLQGDPAVFLSLSGGYDAAGLLGVLGSSLKIPDVRCVSYNFGKPAENSDAYVARQMATLMGYECRIPQCHRGDIVESIKNNAEMGEGVCNYCDECDAWLEMSAEFLENPNSILVAGDNCFGFDSGVTMVTRKDALMNHNKICNFDSLGWFKRIVGKQNYDLMCEGLDNDIAEILKRAPQNDDLYDLASFVYLDQRIGNVLATWREFFPGRFLKICEPFFDNAMLDFVMTLPNSMKRGRSLYRETITAMYPELFEVKRATSGGGVRTWRQEFIAQRENVDSYISSMDSRLDSLVPPHAITKMLDDIRSWKHHKYSPRILPSRFATQVLKGRWGANRILDIFPFIDHKTILRRLLVMRAVLKTA